MPRKTDVYTAAQAAKVLGISERRVRQLVTEGKLPGERGDDNVVRIPQQAVNEERKRRKTTAGPAKASAGGGRRSAGGKASGSAVDVDDLAEKVASVVGKRLEGQLEITHRAESLLRGELDEERARRTEAEARLGDLRAELVDAQARLEEARRQTAQLEAQVQQKRGLFRR